MNLSRLPLLRVCNVSVVPLCNMKYFPPPPNYDDVEMPEKTRLRFVDKVPQLPVNVRPPKMTKRLALMRGPETLHNFLLHKQYGIMALGGGRLKYGHFEMMRLTIGRKMDTNRMFALWRVDAPWQPVTKKGQGHRMGGGKGSIDHYVTPVKVGRIIVELGGKCEYAEVKDFLQDVANKLPFKAMAVSQEILENIRKKEEDDEKNNLNQYTMKYLIQNNMGGCHNWLSPYDLKWFLKYM